MKDQEYRSEKGGHVCSKLECRVVAVAPRVRRAHDGTHSQAKSAQLCCSLVCGAPPVASQKLPPLAMFIRRELSYICIHALTSMEECWLVLGARQ